MKTRVKQLKQYDNQERKVDSGESKEAFKTKKELMFHKKLMLFVEKENPQVIVKQKNKCVIL